MRVTKFGDFLGECGILFTGAVSSVILDRWVLSVSGGRHQHRLPCLLLRGIVCQVGLRI
jgi:hypothetical protein